MSLATKAAPLVESGPATAQLLLPTRAGSGVRVSIASGGGWSDGVIRMGKAGAGRRDPSSGASSSVPEA
jgi:hypothetical protein